MRSLLELWPVDKVRTYTDLVMKLSEIELRLALIMVVDGADVDFAIMTACNMPKKSKEG